MVVTLYSLSLAMIAYAIIGQVRDNISSPKIFILGLIILGAVSGLSGEDDAPTGWNGRGSYVDW